MLIDFQVRKLEKNKLHHAYVLFHVFGCQLTDKETGEKYEFYIDGCSKDNCDVTHSEWHDAINRGRLMAIVVNKKEEEMVFKITPC